MDNDKLFKKAEDVIDELFSDTSVDEETGIMRLKEIREYIDGMIELLEIQISDRS